MDLEISGKGRIVEQILIAASVFINKNIEGRCQIKALRTFRLSDGIDTVRKLLRPGISMLVGNQVVPFRVPGILIGTGGLQEYLKFRPGLNRLQTGAAVIHVFDEIQAAEDDVLIDIQLFRVLLQRILSGRHTEPIDGFIQEISFRWCDLTDVPALAAGIVVGQKISVFICHIGVHEFIITINTVNSSGECGIALGFSVRIAEFLHNAVRVEREHLCGSMLTIAAKRGIDLEDIGMPFLEDIIKSALGHSIPLDRNVLHLRDHISLGGVLFGKRVVRTNRDTLKHSCAGRIGCNGHIHTLTVFGDAGQAENQALHQAVFGGLADFDHTVLAQVGNVQSDKRTVIVDRHFPLRIAVRLVIDRHLGLFYNIIAIDDLAGLGIAVFVCRSDHGDFFTGEIVDGKFCSAEVLPGFGIGFQNFNMTLFEPVISIDRCQAAVCGINGDLPFRLAVRLIVEWEGRLDHSVRAIRNICGFGIATVIGRSDGRYLCAGHIIDRENGALECLVGAG